MHLEAVDTPALVVDLDRVERNLQRVAAACARRGLSLRPHVKTHKSTLLARWQVEAGAQGITVAKLGEAEVMRAGGLQDILVAYPLVGERAERRLADLLRLGTQVTVALDSEESLATVARAARPAGDTVQVLVEVDTGFHRVGVAWDEVVPLARRVADTPGVVFAGLMSFAGHVSQAADEESRRRVLREESSLLAAAADRLAAAGLPPRTVSVGGTHHVARLEEVTAATEIRPGTYVFGDRATLWAGSCREEDCAATVLATVVSVHGTWAVVDAGSKALSSDACPAGGYGQVISRPGGREAPGVAVARLSEEHGILTWSGPSPGLRVGDRVHILPNHVCAAVNLYDRMVGVRAGRVERLLPVEARGRSQ